MYESSDNKGVHLYWEYLRSLPWDAQSAFNKIKEDLNSENFDVLFSACNWLTYESTCNNDAVNPSLSYEQKKELKGMANKRVREVLDKDLVTLYDRIVENAKPFDYRWGGDSLYVLFSFDCSTKYVVGCMVNALYILSILHNEVTVENVFAIHNKISLIDLNWGDKGLSEQAEICQRLARYLFDNDMSGVFGLCDACNLF